MYTLGVISKNDKCQTISFHSCSRLNHFTSSNNRYVPHRRGHRVCSEAKTNRVCLVSPLLIQSSLGMSSGDASRIVHGNLRIFDSFRLLSIKNGCGFPRTLCNFTCFQFDLFMMQFMLQERGMSFIGRV